MEGVGHLYIGFRCGCGCVFTCTRAFRALKQLPLESRLTLTLKISCQAEAASLELVLDADHPALNQDFLCMWVWNGGQSLLSVSFSTALHRFSRLSALFG